VPGTDRTADAALGMMDELIAFLSQPADEVAGAEDAWARLADLAGRLRASEGVAA
jgi:flagellar biosynthesis/type III secretory pathway ATPase